MASNHIESSNEVEGSSITINCPTDHIGEFISDLLGKRQSISRTRTGIIDVDFEWIINTFDLINQRVQSQNDAHLVAFSCEVFLDDGVVRTLNSVEEMRHYNEVKDLISRGVKFNVTYLINFPNKKVPEKQEIEFFIADSLFSENVFYTGEAVELALRKDGFVSFKINYTERTWGDDLEVLIRTHVDKHVGKVPKYKKFFAKYSWIFAIFIFLSSLTIPSSLNRFRIEEKSRIFINKIKENSESWSDSKYMEEYVNLLEFLFKSTNQNIMDVASLFIGLVVSVVFILWSAKLPRSFVIATESAKKYRRKKKGQDKRGLVTYIVMFVIGIVTSIVGNYLYYIS